MTGEELVKLNPKDFQVEGGLTVKEVWGPPPIPEPVVRRRCACGKPLKLGQRICDDCWEKKRVLRRDKKRAEKAKRLSMPHPEQKVSI